MTVKTPGAVRRKIKEDREARRMKYMRQRHPGRTFAGDTMYFRIAGTYFHFAG